MKGDGSRPSDEAMAETVDSGPAAGGARGEPEVGAVLGGRYVIQGWLGKGAFGTVFRAHDRVADRIVAIKVMSDLAVRSPKALQRFRRELQAAVQVTHPAVVRIHDLLEVDGRLMLSMELIDGETLAERLKREPKLPLADLLALVDDLTQALAAAHSVDVIHRDLKPANIMIRGLSGRALVADFGLSRPGPLSQTGSGSTPRGAVEAAVTVEGEVMGTPHYMAPEQMVGRAVKASADIYSLGVVLFEAATGRLPHLADTLPELYALRRYEPAPALESLRPDAPDWLCRVVARCLDKDPDARYPSGKELRQEIADRFAAPARAERTAVPTRRNWRIGIAIALLAAAAGMVAVWARRHSFPTGSPRLAIAVLNRGADTDAWIGPALERMAARRIRNRASHVMVVDHPADADLTVDLRYSRGAGTVRVEASYGKNPTRLGTLENRSISGVVDDLTTALEGRFGQGQPERKPDPSEQSDMDVVGAKSFAAYRLYRRAIEEGFGSQLGNVEALKSLAEQAAVLQPHWAHAHALVLVGVGDGSSEMPEHIRRAKTEAASSSDATGRMLVEALSVPASDGHLTTELDAQFRRTPHDVLLGWTLYRELHAQQRPDEALAVARSLHERYPELQFGADASDFMHETGRTAEVAEFSRRWLEVAPESEEALILRARLDVERGRPDEAAELVRRTILLYGEAPERISTLADVLMLGGNNAEATDMATRLLRGNLIDRSRGYKTLGNLAVIQGRFTSAREYFEKASEEAQSVGSQWHHLAALFGLRSLALVATPAEAETDLRVLEENLRERRQMGEAATVRFERELLQYPHTRCPDQTADLKDVPAGETRRNAERQMLRAAALRGCAKCSDAIKAGLSTDERDTVSLFNFGLCAEHEAAFTLALSAFEQVEKAGITMRGAIPGFFHWILADFHRAKMLEQLNRREEARAAYERFLGHWQHADHPLPEIDQARRALDRLH